MSQDCFLNLSEKTLKWAAESINLDIETIAEIIGGDQDRIKNCQLTFEELEKFSKITNKPLGFLMLKEPPDIPINPYIKDVSYLQKIDIYRICDLYNVRDDPISHAIKKLLCSGIRGSKDKMQDIKEARDSIDRYLEMIEEDKGKISREYK